MGRSVPIWHKDEWQTEKIKEHTIEFRFSGVLISDIFHDIDKKNKYLLNIFAH